MGNTSWQDGSDGYCPDLIAGHPKAGVGNWRLSPGARLKMASKSGRSSLGGEHNPLGMSSEVFPKPFDREFRRPNDDMNRGTFTTLVEAVEQGYLTLDDLAPKERRRVARILSLD